MRKKQQHDNLFVPRCPLVQNSLDEQIKDKLSLYSHSALPSFSLKEGFATFEANEFECHLNGDMLKILGLTHSY